MALTREEVLHIATLCRIALSPEEVERIGGQLSHILEQFQVLGELDTNAVAPTSHSVEMQTVLRDDEPAPCLDKEEVLSNAPQREGDYFKVKVVLEE
jgi:aspartyl-tRNA(Asn)/glutamyl-tRNA(Gln) amidotransferase subunit C